MAAEPVEILIFDQTDYRGRLSLKVGSQEVGVSLKGIGKDVRVGSLVWPESASSASVSGELNFTHYKRGPQVACGSHELPLIDLAPLTKPLRDNSLPMAERLKQFITAQQAFEAKHKALFDGESRVLEIPDEKSPHADIVAAEKRLGFVLPNEHVRLLEDFGPFLVDDSAMLPAKSLKNAFDQMLHDWETPRAKLDELPAKTQALLKTTVLLYTEVGDGYGGWLYQPPQTASDRPSFWWIHQDDIIRPRRLTNQDGSLKNYSQALLWLLTQQVLERYEDTPEECVFVDRSSPGKLKYRLIPDDKPALRGELWLDWKAFE
ncbi:MAG: hypothetical protein ACKV2Q_35175 [Planctomycetaceae bacterium]